MTFFMAPRLEDVLKNAESAGPYTTVNDSIRNLVSTKDKLSFSHQGNPKLSKRKAIFGDL
ncbi:hypothetical protein P5673_019936 [Acropora cervicornis]|uniref:Uncharacterized protein n=1 Tax=Acropora cervicornis TaxID=6130 RepID=A0AAD9QBP7_ACRCE|nr:hypothetical protein P5673_019936 [Acropora cervicornis]